jgi:hypothetical protein
VTKRSFLQPYRAPQPPDEPPAEPERITTVKDLGSLRSSHASVPVLWSRASVDLHFGGLVFRTAESEWPIAFDDIDELWLEQVNGGAIESMRIVAHDGTSHELPADLTRRADVFRALEQRCSRPLERKAFEAIAHGGRLTFGEHLLDRDGVDGPGWAIRWDQLSLVRVVLGKIVIFRGQALLPSHSVTLRDVPHPWIFWALVAKLAPRIEIDDPSHFLRPPPK